MTTNRSIGMEFRILINLIKRKMGNIPNQFKGENITMLHGRICAFVIENKDKDIFQKDIEQELGIRRSTATKMLQIMEKHHLIKREPVAYDARVKKIICTEKVEQLHKEISVKMDEMDKMLIKDLTQEEIEVLFQILEKIKKSIEK